MTWQRTRIELPDDLGPALREAIGREIVERMISNANSGVGVRKTASGVRKKQFPGYTKDYAKFKGQENVDLVLSGDMLADLDVISHKKGSILVGFENGTESNAKAEGNITGSYGKSPNLRKARDFLGLTKSEINEIVRNIRGR